jgi:plasmid stabilization system protein ParE
MKLRYERGALADLDEIFAYIAADNREAAGRLVTRIEHAAARIAVSPHIGTEARLPAISGWKIFDRVRIWKRRSGCSLRTSRCAKASVGRGIAASAS